MIDVGRLRIEYGMKPKPPPKDNAPQSRDSCSDTDSGILADNASDQAEKPELTSIDVHHIPIKPLPPIPQYPGPDATWPRLQKSDTCPEIIRSTSPLKASRQASPKRVGKSLRVRFADEVGKPVLPSKSSTLSRIQDEISKLNVGEPDQMTLPTRAVPAVSTLTRLPYHRTLSPLAKGRAQSPSPLRKPAPPPPYDKACQRIECLKQSYYYTTDDPYSSEQLRAKSTQLLSTFAPNGTLPRNPCIMTSDSCDAIVSLDKTSSPCTRSTRSRQREGLVNNVRRRFASAERPQRKQAPLIGHSVAVGADSAGECHVKCRLVGLDCHGVQTVELEKDQENRPFGFFIASGTFRKKKGIFISRVSAPSLCPVLSIGDQILSVDNQCTRSLPLEQVQGLMAGKIKIVLKVLPAIVRS